ncbi:EEIG1/EHBP1 N-terminal domain [Phaffia rhodozyma]|uniref:EEIG1/EHBP1 N-terminal domain n=1 Tax=Phaffia rhodozyma TaxID=264483 RepID=A0A0F7SU32_PHARH|nr:EEIG1/EHBP1 N-terminal domain [Phaffia rhodozyma]
MGLLNLLPGKRATFNLTVLIDDIHNVPLVNGSLSVRWRFKKYHSKDTELHEAQSPTPLSTPPPDEDQAAESNPLQRIITLQRMITQTQTQSQTQGLAGDQASTHSRDSFDYNDEDEVSSSSSISIYENKSSANISASSTDTQSEKPEGRLQGRLHGWKSRTKNLKKSLLSSATTARQGSTHDEQRSHDSASINSSPPDLLFHLEANSSDTRGGPDSSATGTHTTTVETGSSRVPSVSTRGRGETAKIPIGDHACSWSQRIRSGIQIPISRDGVLGERWLKFIVIQHLSPLDSSTHTEKDVLLGHLELNLAEYAGSGPVTRRYLLDEGKTNATLKVCIELEQVGGQREWNPMLITKGQISGGGLESLVGHDKGSLAGTPVMSSANLNRLCAEARPSFSRKSSEHSYPRPSSLSHSTNSAPGPSTPPLQTLTSSHVPAQSSHLFSSSTNPGSSTNLHSLGSSLQHHLLPHSKGNSSSSYRKSPNHSKPSSSSPHPDSQPQTRGRPTIDRPHTGLSGRDNKSRSSGFVVPSRTEDIIEALFNPFESSTLGPFTVPYSPGVVRKPSDEVMGEDGTGYEAEGSIGHRGKKRTGWKSHHKDKDSAPSGMPGAIPAGAATALNRDEDGDRKKKHNREHGPRQTSGKGFGWKTKEKLASTSEIRM